MDDLGTPKVTSNVLRQAVISCVKSELQQPYNLGVITREQFVKICSSVTKDFLKEAGQNQTDLTVANEGHLKAHTTALLTKFIGGSGAQSPGSPPRPARSSVATPSAGSLLGVNVDTPGAVLASTDDEVQKYQDHLSRLAALSSGKVTAPPTTNQRIEYQTDIPEAAIVPQMMTPTLKASTPISRRTSAYSERIGSGSGGIALPSVSYPQQHQQQQQQQQQQYQPVVTSGTARQLHSEILNYVKKIEDLHDLIENHLQSCEAAL